MATKHALVTGGGRGIGRSVSQRLARDGYHVVVNYRSNADAAQETLSQIQKEGGAGELLPFDVANHDEVQEALKALYKRLGSIDALVNNAGITADTLMPLMSEASWDSVINTSLKGFYNVTRPTVRKMLRQKSGSIVSLSSIAALVPNPGQSNYAAAKAGIIGASKALAAEVAKAGVRVNVVAPGLIATDMTKDLDTTELLPKIPLQRAGTPEEVAAAIAFLCSDEASYITAQVLSVNGGVA